MFKALVTERITEQAIFVFIVLVTERITEQAIFVFRGKPSDVRWIMSSHEGSFLFIIHPN